MNKKRGEDMSGRGEVYTLTQNEHGAYGVRPVEVTLELPEPNSRGPAWMRPDEARPRDPEGELAWQDDALCAQTDPEAFIPDKYESVDPAKRVCGRCTVRAACLMYAFESGEKSGIWGGLSNNERKQLRKQLKKSGGVTLEAVQRAIA